MTKFIHMSIVLQPSWDARFSLSDSVKEELSFWKENVPSLNGRPIERHVSPSRSIVYSDASDLGVGSVVKDHQGVICHLPWTANEMFRSSTWRELKAVHICL